MRKILFRGKSVNNGEWVEGSLVITTIEPADDTPIKHYHIEDMTIGVFPNEHQSGVSETVDPETVGQFTGLTDKHGKKIFEGDIVKHYCGCDDYDLVDTGYVFWDSSRCMFLRTSDEMSSTPQIWSSCKYEVIGNVHDNPELLGVSCNRSHKAWYYLPYGDTHFMGDGYENTPVIAWQPLAQPPGGE